VTTSAIQTNDAVLTKKSMLRILQNEQIDLVNLKSGWSHFTVNQKKININSHAKHYCKAKGHTRRGDNKRVRDEDIWLGVHSFNENLFTKCTIPFGQFNQLSDATAGKIYTTKPVTESKFHTLIIELKK
jgi:hypothetical protein